MENYREIKAVSASLLKDMRKYYMDFDTLERYKYFFKANDSLSLGTLIHETLETKGENLKNYLLFGSDRLDGITPNEKEVLLSENPLVKYLELYNNIDTRRINSNRRLLGDDLTKWDSDANKSFKKVSKKVEEILDRGSNIIQDIENFKSDYGKEPNILFGDSHIKDFELCEDVLSRIDKYILPDSCTIGIERQFLFNYDNIPCKMMVDLLQVDHENKIIWIIDWKTTSDTLKMIPYSYKKWGYDLQSSFYCTGIWLCEDNDIKKLRKQGYKTAFKFIFINTFNGLIFPFIESNTRSPRHGGIYLDTPYRDDNNDNPTIRIYDGFRNLKGLIRKNELDKKVIGWKDLIKKINLNNIPV